MSTPPTATRVTDSALYGHLWGTPDVRAIVGEHGRLQGWLDILAALARAQEELGYLPAGTAEAIATHALVDRLDLDVVARETQRTGHSMLGLIRGLQEILPPPAGEYVYYGATVQDITDTWTALVMKRVGGVVWRDLRTVETHMVTLAEEHRDTVMVGRTHGQAGAPITFGWKVASWADEILRHRQRLREGASRWLVGQLGGALGTAAFFGDDAIALRRRFCDLLGLEDPGMSWLTARDRISEFALALTMITGTLSRVGNEIYALARSDIGELREAAAPEAVSSITMPHKRNPERSEHLVTLARLAQGQAHVLLDGAAHEHERDGRGWKAEWVALPEICLLAGTALELARDVLAGLEVRTEGMAHNVAVEQQKLASERLLAALATRVGKHAAQGILHDAMSHVSTSKDGGDLGDALAGDETVRAHLSIDEIRSCLTAAPDTGAAGRMVDIVIERARTSRSEEADQWP